MATKQLSTNCRLVQLAEAAGQSPAVYLCRMLNQFDTQQEAAEHMGVTLGALTNYLSRLPVTRLTAYNVSATNTTKTRHQWIPLWPESIIGGMGK